MFLLDFAYDKSVHDDNYGEIRT